MADNLMRRPKRGILKNSSSFETVERQKELSKETKWDEMNIIATLHPKDKDYGHMKIDEPKTPYSYDTADGMGCIDADLLAERIKLQESELPKVMQDESNDSSESDPDETEDEKKKRKLFEMKRKHHYNEYQAVKLARKLMEEDDEDKEDSSGGIAETNDADCILPDTDGKSDVL